ncbi:MAG: YkgJ family cysteine cluster protein [Planctomycetes bacterium]|nr:YkgJ family cysteine cluster protein [Planctomycetota bacterium]MCB9912463.1 YkgJ family cysteine cluster protein [Planctomycetota bacterium]
MDPNTASPPPDPRWYAQGLRFECTQCGRCCRSNGEYEHLYLAEDDVLALAGELGLSEAAFLQQYTRELDGWTVLHNPGAACRFLDPGGRCSVYTARPMQCRTWPFWKENLEQPRWTGPVKAICPGLDQGKLYGADEVDRIAEANEDWYEGGH